MARAPLLLLLLLAACAAAQSAWPNVTACPATPSEQAVAALVATRTELLLNGTVCQWIKDGTYGIPDVAQDLTQDFVMTTWILHSTALQSFLEAFEDPPKPPPAHGFANFLKALFGDLLDLLTDGWGPLASIVANDISDFISTANATCGAQRDFYLAASVYQNELVTQYLNDLDWVDDVVDQLRSITDPQQRAQAILDAYNMTTLMIQTMPSVQHCFYAYVALFSNPRFTGPHSLESPMSLRNLDLPQCRNPVVWMIYNVGTADTGCVNGGHVLHSYIRDVSAGCFNLFSVTESCARFLVHANSTEHCLQTGIIWELDSANWQGGFYNDAPGMLPLQCTFLNIPHDPTPHPGNCDLLVQDTFSTPVWTNFFYGSLNCC